MKDDIIAALAPLFLSFVRVENAGAKVVISHRFSYQDPGDPNSGYDDEGEDLSDAIADALEPLGLSFHDAGFEDDGSGREWHVYYA